MIVWPLRSLALVTPVRVMEVLVLSNVMTKPFAVSVPDDSAFATSEDV